MQLMMFVTQAVASIDRKLWKMTAEQRIHHFTVGARPAKIHDRLGDPQSAQAGAVGP